MKKIIVTIPKDKSKWKVSMFGSTGKQRANVNTLFNFVERKLKSKKMLSSRLELKEKTAIVVKEGKDISNESLSSNQPHYLLYCLGCFLEDYLSEKALNRIEKDYSPTD